MSDMMSQLLVLRNVVDAGSKNLPWCGSLAMQKLVYLLEYVFNCDLGYDFGLHHRGPYSSELAGDLSLGAQAKLWECETETRAMGTCNYTGNVYNPLEVPYVREETRATADALWTVIGPKLGMLIDHVKDKTGRDLELIATIHYLRHVQQIPERDLWDVLHGLKPKYTPAHFNRGKELLADMQNAAAPSIQC